MTDDEHRGAAVAGAGGESGATAESSSTARPEPPSTPPGARIDGGIVKPGHAVLGHYNADNDREAVIPIEGLNIAVDEFLGTRKRRGLRPPEAG